MILVCQAVEEGDQVLLDLQRLRVEEDLEDAALIRPTLDLEQVKVDEDQVKVALDLDGDLAPVNLCNGATGCCGTGKHHHRHFF